MVHYGDQWGIMMNNSTLCGIMKALAGLDKSYTGS